MPGGWTGLAGGFDVELTWTPDGPDVTGPSLSTALQEQLGLN